MKNKHIKELILIAAELDSRGLLKEASVLDKLAADIINFEERAKALRPHSEAEATSFNDSEQPGEVVSFEEKRDERRESMIQDFVLKNLSPDAKIYDEDGGHELSGYAYNGNETLAEYMIEVLPDRLSDLYYDIGDSDIQELVVDVAHAAEQTAKSSSKDDPNYSEDFLFLAKAMKFYLIDQEYDFGV
jgi:hypothetical protein